MHGELSKLTAVEPLSNGQLVAGFHLSRLGEWTSPTANASGLQRQSNKLPRNRPRFRDSGALCSFGAALVVLGGLIAPVVCGQGTVMYVDDTASGSATGTTWQDALPDLQGALGVATPGTQIWVAQGVYCPDGGTGAKNLTFDLQQGVELYGGFNGTETVVWERNPDLHPTILSGDLVGNDTPEAFQAGLNLSDNSWHVVVGTNVDEGSVLDGFRIQGAVGEGQMQICDPSAGGALVLDGARPRIRNCVFTMNRASCGPGVYCLNGSAATFEICVFTSNIATAAGGALAICESSPTLRDCTFESNSVANFGLGGAVLVGDGCLPIFDACRFSENDGLWGGAVFIGASSPSLSRCVFASNTSFQGGAMLFSVSEPGEGGVAEVRDSVFLGNTAHDGGAFSIYNSSLVIDFCTIVNNHADQAGGGVLIQGTPAGAIIRNSVVWGNSDEIPTTPLLTQIWIATDPYIQPPIIFSCVEGATEATEGRGNIGLDPQLLDLDGDDDVMGTSDDEYGVMSASPCIDAGADFGGVSEIDFDGAPRVLDGDLDAVMVPDMGAVEFSSVVLAITNTAGGDSIEVSIESELPLWGFLIVGLGDGYAPLPPFGALLMDPMAGFARTFVGQLPYQGSFAVPASVRLPRPVKVQALGLKSGLGAGNLSNAVWVTLSDT